MRIIREVIKMRHHKGHDNLIPLGDRPEEERKRIASLGGKASVEARRKKKNLIQITNMMLNSTLNREQQQAVDDMVGELPDDAYTVNALMVSGQIKSAIEGNSKAFIALTELQKQAANDDKVAKYTIPITDITKDFVEVYRAIHEAFDRGTYREIISLGGRGSIKSNFWAAVAEETIYNDPQAHVVYTRRYKVDLRGSVYNQFQKTITRHGRLDDWDFTVSPMMARYKKTGQCVIFVGADKPISLKSYNLSFGYVKLLIHEECDEMAGIEQMDNIEDTFLRNDVNALDVKVYNPPKSKNNFMNQYREEAELKKDTFVCHSYYYNVPREWLGKRFFERADWFKVNKPLYYANNYLGEVTGTGGGIFENLEVRTISDAEIDNFDSFEYGLDFGYEHPQVFIKCHYDDENDIVYPIEEVYAKRCKNSTFARKIKQYKDVEIICDSARPDNIAEMSDWGFNVVGAVKRWKNKGRAYSWEWLQQADKIVIDKDRTPHLYQELTTLEFVQFKDGTFSSEYPTLDEDCTMALIYALNRVIRETVRDAAYIDDDYDDE
jgi:PBSX family phage terminase large subunit